MSLSPELAMKLGEIASIIRDAARRAIRTPNWGRSIAVDPLCFIESEVSKPVKVCLVPMRREPDGEIIRVDFYSPSGMASPSDHMGLLLHELTPSIIGVGKIRAEKTLEGFKIFLLNEGDPSFSHYDVTPEMIKAGREVIAAQWLEFTGPDGSKLWDKVLGEVFLAMWRAPKRHPFLSS